MLVSAAKETPITINKAKITFCILLGVDWFVFVFGKWNSNENAQNYDANGERLKNVVGEIIIKKKE